MNIKKYLITPIKGEFEYISSFQEELALFRNKEFKVGFINKHGEVAIPLKYYNRFIDKSGKVQIAFYSNFRNGLSCLINDEGKFGCINKNGEVVIPFEYDNPISGDDETHILVKRENKWGFIDRSSKVIIPLEYDYADYFNYETAIVKKNNYWFLINKNGDCIFSFKDDLNIAPNGCFSEGLMPVVKNGKFGYINRNAKLVIPFIFDNARNFSNGVASVGIKEASNNILWGVIDVSGKLIIPFEHKNPLLFINGMAKSEKNGKEIYLNLKGIMIFEVNYDDIGNFFDDITWVKIKDKYGFINKSGEITIPIKFECGTHAMGFHDNYAIIKSGDKFGYIDKSGNISIYPEFDYADVFKNGVAVIKKEGRWGVLKIL